MIIHFLLILNSVRGLFAGAYFEVQKLPGRIKIKWVIESECARSSQFIFGKSAIYTHIYIYNIYIARKLLAYFQDFINKLYCIYDTGKHPNRRATNGARHYSFIYLRIPFFFFSKLIIIIYQI